MQLYEKSLYTGEYDLNLRMRLRALFRLRTIRTCGSVLSLNASGSCLISRRCVAAVLAGGHAALLAEDMGQVALVVEAAAGRDFGEGKFGRVLQGCLRRGRYKLKAGYEVDMAISIASV